MSLEVKDIHRGQDDHSDSRLKQLKPGNGSEQFNMRKGVNHGVLLSSHI